MMFLMRENYSGQLGTVHNRPVEYWEKPKFLGDISVQCTPDFKGLLGRMYIVS